MAGLTPFIQTSPGGHITAGFELRGLPELEAFMRRFQPPELTERLKWASYRVAAKVLHDAAQDVDRDTGVLAESLALDVWGEGADVWGAVFSPESYAIVREFGRRPASEIGLHPPPEGALTGWMERHGMDPENEDALRWGIAIKGSPPHPFLRPALFANARYALTTVTEALITDSLPGVRAGRSAA